MGQRCCPMRDMELLDHEALGDVTGYEQTAGFLCCQNARVLGAARAGSTPFFMVPLSSQSLVGTPVVSQ